MGTIVSTTTQRLRLLLRGAVQGVGFRPTVYRLAKKLSVAGWVRNSATGLEIEVEGTSRQLDDFLREFKEERPRAAVVTTEEVSEVAPSGAVSFEILPSDAYGPKTAAVLPDLAACPACVQELFAAADRRFEYPFTNCTRCGPRYTIVLDIPYDRSNTTMHGFTLCPECRGEYESPQDRRFHAQPNACPACGPTVWSVSNQKKGSDPLADAARALAMGKIVALKGVGGFQLLVDARNGAAVSRLRQRKHREEKAFALLIPSLACVRKYCVVTPKEEELLVSQAAPIVLLRPRDSSDIAPEVAKSSPYFGVLLPYSPLHHLLAREYPFPLVATSGNRSDEPIAIHNEEALERLGEIADVFVLHNRPIARPCDDSVARVLGGGPQIVRRARGYAPLPVSVPVDLPPVLAVGGHLKNTVAIAIGSQVVLSHHIGDLDSPETRAAFEHAIEDLRRLYRFQPQSVVCDHHPDYASTRWALQSGLPVIQVQHHHAHVAACAAENGIDKDYLGVAWDGTGLGLDGTVWGGEFFLAKPGDFERIAYLRPFRLPGGESAIRDCSRPAASLLWETFGADKTAGLVSRGIRSILESGINAPWSSSMGRLFDAVAWLCGLADQDRFEGQAAMSLERAIGEVRTEDSYVIEGRGPIGDWAPLMEALLRDIRGHVDVARIAAKFHNALANWIFVVARGTGVGRVVLSGGVFQNAYLTERAKFLLESSGFEVFWHHQVPSNDGGISLGQAVLAQNYNA